MKLKDIISSDVGTKIYHISNDLYPDLRPLALQDSRNVEASNRIGNKMSIESTNRYRYEINGFCGPIVRRDINKLVSSGFKNWKMGKYYLYEIDLELNKNSIKFLNIVSTPEQINYDDENFDTFYEKNKDLSDSDYKIARDGYFNKRAKYLAKIGLTKDMSIDEYIKYISNRDYNPSKFIDKNIKLGNKNQYASYIPHVQIYVTKPIIYDNVIQL